jgi:two-component system sensor histidine kinase CreC
VRFSFKIFLGFFLIIGLGAYLFFVSFMEELKPVFRQSSEESLVDTANLLAELVAPEMAGGNLSDGRFAAAVDAFGRRKLNAQIWSHVKTRPSLQIYITDALGKVVYDSGGQHLGEDFSRWNDVYLTLRGRYGVRSSLADPGNPLSTVMHVAAPVVAGNGIIGVVTVAKPNLSVEPFFQAAERHVAEKGLALFAFALAAGLTLSLWLSRSVRQLARYADAVRDGRQVQPPRVHGVELQQLAAAMAAMKAELEGKKYVEHYVHTLTHQLKTPLTSILGAAELLHESMPEERRQRFIANIRGEAARLQQIVQHMLALAAIENRERLDAVEDIDLDGLLQDVVQSQWPAIQRKSLSIAKHIPAGMKLQGERFLLQQALSNLLDNAVGFSPLRATLTLQAECRGQAVSIAVIDQGPGIPEFARQRLFERFYSLPRPGSDAKGSGLGLCFVKEIARLHGGAIALGNRDPHGVEARLTLHATHT